MSGNERAARGWSRSFERFAAVNAVAAGVASLAYAVAFLVLRSPVAASLSLLLTGVFATVAIVAVYGRVRAVDGGFALWALVLGIVGSLGAIVHGGYDLANALQRVNPFSTLPNAFDPRGLVTFGVSGLGTLVVSWLVLRGGAFPRLVGYLGIVLGVLLIVIYVGRLTVLDPNNPIIAAPAVAAGLASPVWYLLVGLALWRGASATSAAASADAAR